MGQSQPLDGDYKEKFMELAFLQYLQTLRTPFLDSFFITLTDIIGPYGLIVLIPSLILTAFAKTRKCGILILGSFLLAALLGAGIKQLLVRPRPFMADNTIQLIIDMPKGFSCPSNHTALAFAAATAIYFFKRSWGTIAFAIALVVGFSRLYLFVHYPSDVLLGAALGLVSAYTIKAKFTKQLALNEEKNCI